jgi:leader peptidase (prepilin peptidase) / N-methyltransferase
MQALFIQSPLVFIVLAFIFALLIGSFLNVVILRLPIMLERDWRSQCEELAAEPASELPVGRFDLVEPRSRCPSCGHQITPMQNIPLVSYILLAGKCADCGTHIPLRYPVIELLTAVLTAVVAWRFGFGWESAAAILLTWILIAISVIDIDHQIIPDSISLPLVWIGLTLSLFHPMNASGPLFIDPKSAIAGALAGYLSLWSIYHLFLLITGKEGMGYGDFKLLAALGAWLGWTMLPVIILMSAVVGALTGIALIVTKRQERSVPIPFGPYLAAAGWIAMLWGQAIVAWYLDLMS